MKHSQGRAFHLLIMLLVSIAIGSAGLSWLLFNSSLFNNADTGPSTLQPISTLDSLRIPRLEDLQASPENPAAGRQDQAPVAETPSGPAPPPPVQETGETAQTNPDTPVATAAITAPDDRPVETGTDTDNTTTPATPPAAEPENSVNTALALDTVIDTEPAPATPASAEASPAAVNTPATSTTEAADPSVAPATTAATIPMREPLDNAPPPNLISLAIQDEEALALEEDIPSPDEADAFDDTLDGLLDLNQDIEPPRLPGQATTAIDTPADSSTVALETDSLAADAATADSRYDAPTTDTDTSTSTALPVSPDDAGSATETALADPQAEPATTATDIGTAETLTAEDDTAPPDPRDVVIIEPESTPAEPAVAADNTASGTETAVHSGWIYAGQFQNGRWIQSGIRIAPDQLPQAGARYELLWGTTIRSGPPSRRTNENGSNLGQNIGYLQDGTQVDILTVKPSGTQGHYWLEIRYN